jgi:hypothetical protein
MERVCVWMVNERSLGEDDDELGWAGLGRGSGNDCTRQALHHQSWGQPALPSLHSPCRSQQQTLLDSREYLDKTRLHKTTHHPGLARPNRLQSDGRHPRLDGA